MLTFISPHSYPNCSYWVHQYSLTLTPSKSIQFYNRNRKQPGLMQDANLLQKCGQNLIIFRWYFAWNQKSSKASAWLLCLPIIPVRCIHKCIESETNAVSKTFRWSSRPACPSPPSSPGIPSHPCETALPPASNQNKLKLELIPINLDDHSA